MHSNSSQPQPQSPTIQGENAEASLTRSPSLKLKLLVVFNLLAIFFALAIYLDNRSHTPISSLQPTPQSTVQSGSQPNLRHPCASLNLPGYKLANLDDRRVFSRGAAAEFLVDFAGAGEAKLVRVYNEIVDPDAVGGREKPVALKIFSGDISCLNEEFSYTGEETNSYGNELSDLQIIANFWQNRQTAAVFMPLLTGYGSGYSKTMHIITYQSSQYRVTQGPGLSELSLYKFAGGENPGREILVGQPKWAEEESHFEPHRYRLEQWLWTGNSYRQQELGLTKNKYDLSVALDNILQAEPHLKP